MTGRIIIILRVLWALLLLLQDVMWSSYPHHDSGLSPSLFVHVNFFASFGDGCMVFSLQKLSATFSHLNWTSLGCKGMQRTILIGLDKLAYSGSQSQHSIWVILPTCRASHIIKRLCIWWIALSTFQTMSAITLTKSEVRQWSVISGNRPQTAVQST